MIEELKKNIDAEIGMLREISIYSRMLRYSTEEEKRLLKRAIRALKEGIRIINDSVPELLKNISIAKELPVLPSPRKKKKPELEKVKFMGIESEISVVLSSKLKNKFLNELRINEQFIRKLKKRRYKKREKYEEFKASRGILKLANKLFLNSTINLVKKGYFRTLSIELRKANIDILLESYVALVLFSTLLGIVFSIFIFVLLIFFNIGLTWPFFELYKGSFLLRLAKLSWIPIALPIATFLSAYFYPSTEKKSIEKKINQELPFAVIHMSAISGSGITPSEIFKIIGLSGEYPYLKKEIRKVLNQINLFGHDLITALNNASKTSPSEKLSELFSGLSTAITSGSDLPEFLEKRSESLLLTYRLEREKYTRLVETFLDIYISIVIAAPMIFMLLIIMIGISGIKVGFTSFQIGLLGVFIIALLNIVFLVFLQLKQPSY